MADAVIVAGRHTVQRRREGCQTHAVELRRVSRALDAGFRALTSIVIMGRVRAPATAGPGRRPGRHGFPP